MKWKQLENTKDPDLILADKLGSSYRKYRDRWEESGSLKTAHDYPVHLDFELDFGCNLKCPQCLLQAEEKEFPQGHPYHKDTPRQKISFEKFKEIIDEGVKYGLCSITVGVNNEPLLNRQLPEFIGYAREKGVVDVILITNATLLDEKKAEELIDSGLTKLYFSLDAIKEDTYKLIRRGGDLKQVTENINAFLGLKKKKGASLPVTRVSFVKSRFNQGEADEFVKYWKDRVDFVSIQAFMPPTDSQKIREDFYIKNEELKEPGPCPQPYQRLTIYHDGSVHPCCNWPGATMVVGNIHRDSIYNIWNSEKMKKIRASVNDKDCQPEECRKCRAYIFG